MQMGYLDLRNPHLNSIAHIALGALAALLPLLGALALSAAFVWYQLADDGDSAESELLEFAGGWLAMTALVLA